MADFFAECLNWEKVFFLSCLQGMVGQATWEKNGNCNYQLWSKYIIPNFKPILPISQK